MPVDTIAYSSSCSSSSSLSTSEGTPDAWSATVSNGHRPGETSLPVEQISQRPRPVSAIRSGKDDPRDLQGRPGDPSRGRSSRTEVHQFTDRGQRTLRRPTGAIIYLPLILYHSAYIGKVRRGIRRELVYG